MANRRQKNPNRPGEYKIVAAAKMFLIPKQQKGHGGQTTLILISGDLRPVAVESNTLKSMPSLVKSEAY